MELDDLKDQWQKTGLPVSPGKYLTSKTIDKMTQKKYNSLISRIKYPELAGSITCLLAAFYLLFNFRLLDSMLFQCAGVLAILLLIVMPVLSYISLGRFNKLPDMDRSHSDVLRIFACSRIEFLKFQRFNTLVAYLLLVLTVMLIPKLFGSGRILHSKIFWLLAFTVGYAFLVLMNSRVKKSYNRSLKQVEALLQETL